MTENVTFINSDFWSDPVVRSLTHDERLLLMYWLTAGSWRASHILLNGAKASRDLDWDIERYDGTVASMAAKLPVKAGTVTDGDGLDVNFAMRFAHHAEG